MEPNGTNKEDLPILQMGKSEPNSVALCRFHVEYSISNCPWGHASLSEYLGSSVPFTNSSPSSIRQPTMATKTPRLTTLLQRAHLVLLALGSVYLLLLTLGGTPFMQTQ